MKNLSETDRDLLWDVADVLVPATDTMPALREADPTGEWLERASEARADVLVELQQTLQVLRGTPDLATALRGLHAAEREVFDVVANVVAGAYYMVPRVRELIGYPGQLRVPAPLDLAADELSDEIFEGAMNYVGGYRHTPA